MKVLIDTHTFLWIAAEPEKLSDRAREVCSVETLVLSVASVWEISIKSHIGRLKLPGPSGDYLAKQIRYGGISVLPIQFRHAVAAAYFRPGTKILRSHAGGAVPEGTPALRDEGPFFGGVRR
jgi:PIN domain nuclease of toxin-antitoxin system